MPGTPQLGVTYTESQQDEPKLPQLSPRHAAALPLGDWAPYWVPKGASHNPMEET